MSAAFERLSVEPSRRCSKGCAFCYNGSSPEGAGAWTADMLVAFARDCAAHGVRALSLGGGEPLEWEGLFETLTRLRGVMFRAVTTNGLALDDAAVLDALVAAAPDKVHVSLHAPENPHELARVTDQALTLARRGLRSGVNLLVRRSRVDAARAAADFLRTRGLGDDRVVFLPLRGPGDDAPSDRDVARAAGGRFQSMSCLAACAPSPRFVSVAADLTVAWCSYTTARRPLRAPTWAALVEALDVDGDALGLTPCTTGLVALRPRRDSVRRA